VTQLEVQKVLPGALLFVALHDVLSVISNSTNIDNEHAKIAFRSSDVSTISEFETIPLVARTYWGGISARVASLVSSGDIGIAKLAIDNKFVPLAIVATAIHRASGEGHNWRANNNR